MKAGLKKSRSVILIGRIRRRREPMSAHCGPSRSGRMRSIRALGALTGILSLGNAAMPAASQLEPLTRDSVLAMADRHFGIAEEAGGTAVVAVVKDGQVLAMKGYGFDKPGAKKIVDPSVTLYRIGSVSKLFAAIATMQLIERHVIDPNADINAYLSKVGVKIE